MIKLTDEAQEWKNKIEEIIEHYLVEGVEVVASAYIGGSIISGGRLKCSDEIEQERLNEVYKDDEIGLKHAIKKLLFSLPSYKRVKLIISKGQEIVIREYTPEEILMDIRTHQLKMMERQKLECIINNVCYSSCKDDNKPVEYEIQQIKIKDGEEKVRSITREDFEYLYYSFDRSVSDLRIVITKNNMTVEANKAFPEWNIGLIQKGEVLDIDGSDIQALLSYMESYDESKIRKAIEAIENIDTSKQLVEKR